MSCGNHATSLNGSKASHDGVVVERKRGWGVF
jgi:hypothetical protein